jgi:ribosome-associated heat shock protein Hsp15
LVKHPPDQRASGASSNPNKAGGQTRATVRVDKWLWRARFFKSRALATETVVSGHCRINGTRIVKPSHPVGAGDTLTIPIGSQVRLIRVIDAGVRRGPPGEAQAMYLDLDVPAAAPRPLE